MTQSRRSRESHHKAAGRVWATLLILLALSCQQVDPQPAELLDDAWLTEDVLSLLAVCARPGGAVDPCTELPPSFDFAWRGENLPESPIRLVEARRF